MELGEGERGREREREIEREKREAEEKRICAFNVGFLKLVTHGDYLSMAYNRISRLSYAL